MRVISVVPFAEGSESATVTVTDGAHLCHAFSWPCDTKEGSELLEPLQVFDESGLMLTEEGEPRLERTNAAFGHRGVALVVDANQALLAIGGLRLEVSGPLPGGISSGDMVEFECVRIDL